MDHEKIFKREDGKQVKVSLWLTIGNIVNPVPKYHWHVWIRGKGKKNWKSPVLDTYTYGRLSFDEKDARNKELYLQHATIEEVQETALELWEKIKPQADDFTGKY